MFVLYRRRIVLKQHSGFRTNKTSIKELNRLLNQNSRSKTDSYPHIVR